MRHRAGFKLRSVLNYRLVGDAGIKTGVTVKAGSAEDVEAPGGGEVGGIVVPPEGLAWIGLKSLIFVFKKFSANVQLFDANPNFLQQR